MQVNISVQFRLTNSYSRNYYISLDAGDSKYVDDLRKEGLSDEQIEELISGNMYQAITALKHRFDNINGKVLHKAELTAAIERIKKEAVEDARKTDEEVWKLRSKNDELSEKLAKIECELAGIIRGANAVDGVDLVREATDGPPQKAEVKTEEASNLLATEIPRMEDIEEPPLEC